MAANNTIKEGAPYADFAKRLMELRKSKGWTRAQLAENANVNARTLINYENGTRIPFADTALNIAKTFGITVEELLGEQVDEQQKAAAIDNLEQLYGKKAADQASGLLGETDKLLAGGTLTQEQQDDFILEMQKLFILATERAKKKYTPNKYRSEDKEEASRKRLETVKAIDETLADRRRSDE